MLRPPDMLQWKAPPSLTETKFCNLCCKQGATKRWALQDILLLGGVPTQGLAESQEVLRPGRAHPGGAAKRPGRV